jgi:hypothetical protein
MMAVSLALLGILLVQEPSDLDKLKKQLAELQERVGQLEKQTLDDARLIQRLREAIRAYEGAAPSDAPPIEPPPPRKFGTTQQPIRGRVEHVDARNGFIVINVGERHGVLVGMRFEILREKQNPGGAPSLEKIAVGDVEKFLGQERSMSKLKIVEGQIADIRNEDEAVAYRDVEAPLPPKPKEPEPPRQGVYKITGVTPGNGFVINYGTSEGAHQTDVVMVYKDGKLKAKLRLDTVEREFSVGKVIDGTQFLAPEMGDQVFLQEVNKKAPHGRVRLIDEQRGVFVDLGQNNFGVKAAQRLEVRREGQRVGLLRITQADKFHSWARPEGETKYADLRQGDFVELIEEK